MSVRRNIISCGNCRTMYEVKGRNPRCPACNARYEDFEPLPPLPPKSMAGFSLEDPEFERDTSRDEYAPLSEFIAAGLVLVSFIVMLVGFFTATPPVFLGGMAMLGVSAVVIAGVKLIERLRSGPDTRPADDLGGGMHWLVGNFWRRRW